MATDPFLGEIQAFGFNFAPRGWAKCDGQLLQIATNTALFSLLGTIYGGDGRTTFALPDLRGRVPMHHGTGPGLTNRVIGARDGAETVTLTTQQIPSHDHPAVIRAANAGANMPKPDNRYLAGSQIYHDGPGIIDMAPDSVDVQPAGGGLGHPNMQPFLVINWCIALVGVFPSRN